MLEHNREQIAYNNGKRARLHGIPESAKLEPTEHLQKMWLAGWQFVNKKINQTHFPIHEYRSATKLY